MATTYDGINYFPIAVNSYGRERNGGNRSKIWHERTHMDCKLKLLCKIYKEGHYIPWG